ncbi:type I restriction endonuclease [Candidatus Palauibacter sp.]|uniref:type I restriction endonuclease n=1 Tax=Candidatus Palauibacter sp. TaxID=3101350 RepID=UPI003B026DB4
MHDGCKEIIRDIVERIDTGEFRSETDVRRGIVDPLLQELGWPVSRPRVVEREYQVEDGRVDYALCPKGKPLVFIEAKRPRGVSDTGRKQLFRYCAAHGVPMAVLTDGREWHFYLPLRQGTLAERRLPPIDLSSDATEVCRKLSRYLVQGVVTSGKNIEAATNDLERMQLERVCESVWRDLFQRPQDDALDMFLSALGRKGVVDPPRTAVAGWLRTRATGETPAPPSPPLPPPPPPPPPPVQPDPAPISRHTVTCFGEVAYLRSGVDVLVKAFSCLAERDPHFLRRYSDKYPGRKKLRVARTRREIHPDDRVLRERCRRLPGGWWIDSNLSNLTKEQWIRQACEEAGVRFGHDLRIKFSRPKPRRSSEGARDDV